MKKVTGFIPNALTLLNLITGSFAIVYAVEGNLGMAGILILIASVFDFADGFAARLLNSYSDMGKQLDSLADVVSFGVAPGIIAFVLLKRSMFGMNIPMDQITVEWWRWIILGSASLIPAFSAYRLAKFNLDTRQSINFLGLPTPANAILWAAFGLMITFSAHSELMMVIFTLKNIFITIFFTSILLISELPMFSLKLSGWSFYENWHRFIYLISVVLLIVFMGFHGLAISILLYIALSISFYLLKIRI